MRFLLETYPEGIDRIQGRDLFKQWCSWCAEERHETGSNTRFGGLVKKVRVGAGLDAKGVSHRVINGRKVYTVTSMKDFPLATYFGVVAVTPHPLDNPHPNHPPADQPDEQESEQRGDSGDSSSFSLERLENIYIEPIEGPISTKETLCTPEPSPPSSEHPAESFTEASWATSSPTYISGKKDRPVFFSGQNGAHLIGKLPGPKRDSDLMLVRTPSGKIIGCSRNDYTLEQSA